MNKAIQSIVLLLLLVFASCSSLKHTFDPPLVTDSELIEVKVTRIQHKRNRLRVWLWFKNKSDSTLHLSYGSFEAQANGNTYPGALRVFIKTTKEFRMAPGLNKKFNGPMEFEGVPAETGTVHIVVDNIRLEGKKGAHKLEFDVPVADAVANEG